MMLFHADKRPLKSHLRPLSVLVLHLLLTHSCRGQSQLIGSSQPIVATLGDDIILPCCLEPAEDVTGLTLEWTRPDLNPRFVYVWRSEQELVAKKHKSFEGRTSLFVDELKFGNISLRLSKVKLSDHGTYRCFIPALDTHTVVHLVVGAVSAPVITLAGVDKATSGVMLQCECAGWHPEPEVLWLDGEGKLLSAGPTETVRGPDDLYTVSSRVTVEKRHSNSFTCRVQQRNINQTRETHISVSDDFFKAQSSFSVITGLAVSLAVWIVMFIVLLLLFLWKWRQDIIKTKKSPFQSGEEEKKKTDKPDDQFVTEEEIKPLKEEVEKKSKPVHKSTGGRDKRHGAGPAVPARGRGAERRKEKQQLQEEQQRRKDAESTIETLREELETQKKELEEYIAAQSTSKFPLTITTKQTLKNVQQRRKKAETQVCDLRQEVKDKIKELQEEQRRRVEAEERVKTLEEELQAKEDELQKQRVLLAEQQNTTHTGKMNLKKPFKQRVQKQQSKEDPEAEVQTPKGKKNVKTKDKQADVQQLQHENQTTENNQQTLNQKDHNQPANQDSAKNDITVGEVNVDGKFVRLSNNSEKDQPMGDWELHIQVNKRKPIKYQFYPSFILKAGNTVTIWASGCDVSCETSTDLTWYDQQPWGTGEELLVTIYSNTGELEVRRMLVLPNSQSNLQQQQPHPVSQDSAMGNITVSEIDLKGSYVRLSNTSNKDQAFKGWELHKQINDRKPIVYKFFSSFILEAGNTVTIWSSDHPGRNKPPTDLVWFSQKSWGTGEELLVTLYNNTGEEMARMLKTPDTAAV